MTKGTTRLLNYPDVTHNSQNKQPQFPFQRANNVSKSVSSIFELISSKKWGKLKTTLLKRSIFHKTSISKCSGPCCSSCTRDHSILHFACQFHPPLTIVKLLTKANQKSAWNQDCKDRYALHIACKHGCDPEVITFFLKINPDAAKKIDIKGRSAFHLACKSYVQKSDFAWKIANKNLIKVVSALNTIDPMSHSLEDRDGITPLEYALCGELSMKVVNFVQAICEESQNRAQEKNIIVASQTAPLNYTQLCMKKNYVLSKSHQSNVEIVPINSFVSSNQMVLRKFKAKAA